MKEKNLMKRIIRKALNAGGIDLLTDNADQALNKVLDGSVIEKIPVLGTIAKAVNIGMSIRDQLFENKLERFLTDLSRINLDEIKEFNEQMNNDPELQAKVGKKVLLLLERMDDMEKPSLLAKAFKCYMKSEINFDKFSLIGRAVDRCTVSGLKKLTDFKSPTDKHAEFSQELALCGLVNLVSLPLVTSPDAHATYRLTNFGEEFIRLLL